MLTFVGSAINKAKTLQMEHVKGRKFKGKQRNKAEEIQLTNLANLGSLASKHPFLFHYHFVMSSLVSENYYPSETYTKLSYVARYVCHKTKF